LAVALQKMLKLRTAKALALRHRWLATRRAYVRSEFVELMVASRAAPPCALTAHALRAPSLSLRLSGAELQVWAATALPPLNCDKQFEPPVIGANGHGPAHHRAVFVPGIAPEMAAGAFY
jgi:hypothetical protein